MPTTAAESFDAFGRFYRAVNAEWPPYGMSDSEKDGQERRWRFAMGHFPEDALAHAMKRALTQAKKRPRSAELIEWAQEHSGRSLTPREYVPPHWTRCRCGCGGRLWFLVLRDPVTGEVRHHAPTIEAMTAKLGGMVGANPAVAARFAPLCGQPMLRFKCECKRNGGDPLPGEAFYLGLEDGAPVYDALTPSEGTE